jgi:hypothetical protein
MTAAETDYKKSQGKDLFVKGFYFDQYVYARINNVR